MTISKKYISLQYDQKSQRLLREYCTKNGFDLTKTYNGVNQSPIDFDFHTTIFYTSNEVYLSDLNLKLMKSPVYVHSFGMLGDQKDIPVLLLKPIGKLKDMREKYEKLGLKDDHPTFKPHISLSYAKHSPDLSKLNLPRFDLYVDELIVESL